MTPVVTYNHFTVPRWMARRGGRIATDAPGRFADFATRATGHFDDHLSWVCTPNEPNLMAMMRSTGVLAMGSGDRTAPVEPVASGMAGIGGFDPSRYRMEIVSADLEQMASAHHLAVQAIKAVRGVSGVDIGPGRSAAGRGGGAMPGPASRQTGWLAVAAEDDFVGVQTYSRPASVPRKTSRTRRRCHHADRSGGLSAASATRCGWLPHTQGYLWSSLRAAWPLTTTAPGSPTPRVRSEVSRAASMTGFDVREYIHWTLPDNFEWNAGFSKTFGLVTFDHDTFERTVKPSARWLGQVARRTDREMVSPERS